ncbi:MAG: hypothetical protein ACM3UU_06710 [Ignavibacteriales bacterium]
MYFFLIFSGLFIVGAISNLYNGEYKTIPECLFASLICFIIYYFLNQEKKKSVEFINWIIQNKNNIENGGTYLEFTEIKPETELIQFQICISFIFFSVKSPSRFLVKGYDKTLSRKIICTIISLLFGWWAIPWGPIYTIQTISNNLVGGKIIKVSELLGNINKADNLTDAIVG